MHKWSVEAIINHGEAITGWKGLGILWRIYGQWLSAYIVPADACCEWCVVKQGRVSLPLWLVHVFQKKSVNLFLYFWSLRNKKKRSFTGNIIFSDTFQSAFFQHFILCNVLVLLSARLVGCKCRLSTRSSAQPTFIHVLWSRSTHTWWRSSGKSASYAQQQSFLLLNNCISFPLYRLQ